ncbi:MAG: FAD-binding oxidoreductase [Vicinamibacterales bacterium]
MRPVYGRSPWLDRFPKSRVPTYPKYKGSLDTDVVVIGGGLAGCAAAYAFAAAGTKVVLMEADRIGRGASGSAAGWITDTPAVGFGELESAIGRRGARHAFQAWRRAALDLEALLRRLDVKCHLEPRESMTVAQALDQAHALAREKKRRAEASVDTQSLVARAIGPIAGFPAAAALRTRDGAIADPYRAIVGLAAAAAARGAVVFERSAVTKTTFTRDDATVVTAAGSIRTRRIVVTTGQAGALFKPLARHLGTRTRYFVMTEPVPAKVRKSLGSRDHLIRDTATPPHHISWVDDERIVVSGADSDAVPARSRGTVLVQRTGQLMYELSTFYPDISGLQPAYGWDATYTMTATGLPIVGPHRNYPHHLFAFGGPDDGLTAAYLASRILLRHHVEDTQGSDDVFAFGR